MSKLPHFSPPFPSLSHLIQNTGFSCGKREMWSTWAELVEHWENRLSNGHTFYQETLDSFLDSAKLIMAVCLDSDKDTICDLFLLLANTTTMEEALEVTSQQLNLYNGLYDASYALSRLVHINDVKPSPTLCLSASRHTIWGTNCLRNFCAK